MTNRKTLCWGEKSPKTIHPHKEEMPDMNETLASQGKKFPQKGGQNIVCKIYCKYFVKLEYRQIGIC